MMPAAQTTGAASAAPTFDPAEWLSTFADAGGIYGYQDDGRLWMGWQVNRGSHQLARMLLQLDGCHGLNRVAVMAHLASREVQHG